LRRAGLKPVLTIHHFSDPIWWNDLSGWEKEENLVYFVNFAKLLFTEYHEKVYMWCTINEPEVFVLGGWFGGHFPPGKRMSPLAGVVMKNLLEAHVQVYVALKSLPGGDTARIGIVKNYTQVDPLRDWHILDQIVAGQANKAFNVGILDFFLTGRFKFWMPGFQNVDHTNRFATKSNDFVGLNYYSHQSAAFQWSLKDPVLLTHREREKNIMTDMPYPIYAEGFHRAIMEMTKLGRPIYITENGVADERDDFRSLWIRRYFYAMSKAMREGADIRGFFYWSLYDNFEWSFGTSMRFGLYHNDFKTQKRTLRAGSMAFVNAVKKWSKNSSSEDDNSNEEELLF
jgi:beta-glucosidase